MTNIERFFTKLEERLETAHRENRDRCQSFFDDLKPRLEAAKKLEHELNRHLAHRFNVLNYLRTDELGLSRIIADLLNPEANHGQGPLFLHTLLTKLNIELPESDQSLTDARVFVEHSIRDQRRIDIYIQIPDGDRTFCLAIENKPYAGDQQNQVVDYLKHLRGKYIDRFLLLYLSPSGDGPSKWSLPPTELEHWRGCFAIMPYQGTYNDDEPSSAENGADTFQGFRTRCSLNEWLAACRAHCQVERLRWFLRDTETFCRRKFGGHAMTTNRESRAIHEFLLSSEANDRLKTAQAVYESWPGVRDQICKKFLEHLCAKIEREILDKYPEFADGLQVDCKYGGEAKWTNWLSIYRKCWNQYRGASRASMSKGRTGIVLEAGGKGPFDWWYGVRSPVRLDRMADADRDRRSRLEEKFGQMFPFGKPNDHWPLWSWSDSEKRNWYRLVPQLFRECKEGSGDITDYYIGIIVKVAERALLVITEIEGPQG